MLDDEDIKLIEKEITYVLSLLAMLKALRIESAKINVSEGGPQSANDTLELTRGVSTQLWMETNCKLLI